MQPSCGSVQKSPFDPVRRLLFSNTMASLVKYCLKLMVITSVLVTFVVCTGSRYRPESYTCRLLNSKFVDSQPWLEYPIVFAPIHRGRLTIWSGVSSLPASEFKCYSGKNGTGSILLDFSNYADKLEWTYFDSNKGTTSHGISVSHREDIVYRIHFDGGQLHSHLDCNKIDKIDFSEPAHETPADIRTTCRDCKSSTISLINSQIGELLKEKLNENIMDGLYWHLTQLISSQHFSGPIPL